MPSMMNRVGDSMIDMVGATLGQLREYQKGPLGTEPKSEQEQAALWRQMKLLPQEQFYGLLGALQEKTGHKQDEEEDCEMCKFLRKFAGR
jgi:hypothetical protein